MTRARAAEDGAGGNSQDIGLEGFRLMCESRAGACEQTLQGMMKAIASIDNPATLNADVNSHSSATFSLRRGGSTSCAPGLGAYTR